MLCITLKCGFTRAGRKYGLRPNSKGIYTALHITYEELIYSYNTALYIEKEKNNIKWQDTL